MSVLNLIDISEVSDEMLSAIVAMAAGDDENVHFGIEDMSAADWKALHAVQQKLNYFDEKTWAFIVGGCPHIRRPVSPSRYEAAILSRQANSGMYD